MMSIKSRLRRPIRACLGVLLRWRSRPFPFAAGTTALVLAPHPDDEALGCGGLIFRKRARGAVVRVAYLTDGSASHPGHPTLTTAALARQRQDEARRAASILGLGSDALHFLGAPDGTLARLDPPAAEALAARIARLLEEIRPDEIFLPCRRDGSSEHEAAFLLVARARELAANEARLFEFPVWAWWAPQRLIRPLRCSRRIWRLDLQEGKTAKAEAIAAHVSQLQPVPPDQQAVLSPEFAAAFVSPEEFFFET